MSGGTIIFMIIEGYSLVDSFYFCFITLSTIGCGDFSPSTDLGKLVTVAYGIVGLGIIAALISAIALVRRTATVAAAEPGDGRVLPAGFQFGGPQVPGRRCRSWKPRRSLPAHRPTACSRLREHGTERLGGMGETGVLHQDRAYLASPRGHGPSHDGRMLCGHGPVRSPAIGRAIHWRLPPTWPPSRA